MQRKITGIKLGQSIQRDILKRIPKLGDEKKLAAIQRDPVIEIDVSGRQLGEEGLALLCDAIEELAETKLSKVEELGLSGNDLTVECLRHLRRAIYMCPDLRDIDISNNNITIRTSSDIEEWTSFLRSFRMLRGLRRLEASNNPIGDIGLEILLRVYASEKDIFIPYDSSGASMEEPENEGSDVNYVVEGFDIRQSGGHLYLASHFPQTVEVDTFEIGQSRSPYIFTFREGKIVPNDNMCYRESKQWYHLQLWTYIHVEHAEFIGPSRSPRPPRDSLYHFVKCRCHRSGCYVDVSYNHEPPASVRTSAIYVTIERRHIRYYATQIRLSL